MEIVTLRKTTVNIDFAQVDSGFLGVTISIVNLLCSHIYNIPLI